jgi:hypothetical protein
LVTIKPEERSRNHRNLNALPTVVAGAPPEVTDMRRVDILTIAILAAATFAVVSTALAAVAPAALVAPPALTCEG